MCFSDPETWLGGFYELAIELGSRSDDMLQLALERVWSAEGVEGPFPRCDLEPSAQSRVEPTLEAVDLDHLYGLLALPNAKPVACGCVTIREEDGPDWFVFYVPMGALEATYEVGTFPFSRDPDSKTWRSALDARLASVAQRVFECVPYSLALIGHDVSGLVDASEVERTGMPPKRWIGYLWPENGTLGWYPPTGY